MIDRLLSSVKQSGLKDVYEDYSPEQSVRGCTYNKVQNADTLTVVFPPWHSNGVLSKLIHFSLSRAGSDSLVYDFDSRMLNPDASSVRRSFEHAAIRISEEVNHITGSYKKINLLGFSLGNVALSMTAETLDDVAGVTMVVPGSELATPFWTGIRTRRLSDEYRDTGHTLEAIREEWVKLAPIAHLEVLRGSKTSVVLARHDEYIPYESGQLLVDSMQQAGINPYVTTMNCGHVSAITRFAVGKIG